MKVPKCDRLIVILMFVLIFFILNKSDLNFNNF